MKKAVILMVALIVTGIFFLRWIYSYHGNPIRIIQIDGERFRAEVVFTPEKIQRGLSGRESLCEKCAMLFVFENPGKYSFWMKDMKFPIDILWIREGAVVFMKEDFSENSSEIISPSVDADSVIEIPGGTVRTLGIGIGSTVKIK